MNRILYISSLSHKSNSKFILIILTFFVVSISTANAISIESAPVVKRPQLTSAPIQPNVTHKPIINNTPIRTKLPANIPIKPNTRHQPAINNIPIIINQQSASTAIQANTAVTNTIIPKSSIPKNRSY